MESYMFYSDIIDQPYFPNFDFKYVKGYPISKCEFIIAFEIPQAHVVNR
jgi:hypothetical protein